jgi:hypothetical protein
MKRSPIQSSNLKSIGYDPASQTLEIEFSSGHVYQYAGVSAKHHSDLVASDSPGSHFAKHIRNGGFKAKKIHPA